MCVLFLKSSSDVSPILLEVLHDVHFDLYKS